MATEESIQVTNTGYTCSCGNTLTSAVTTEVTKRMLRHARTHEVTTVDDIREYPEGNKVMPAWKKGFDSTKGVRLDGHHSKT